MMSDNMKIFDAWWDKNEAQFSADACHMSEYHMASVAFLAGTPQWQPIETAPRNGASILVRCVGAVESFVVVAWDKKGSKWVRSWTLANDNVQQPKHPTHWMPLPEAPEEDES